MIIDELVSIVAILFGLIKSWLNANDLNILAGLFSIFLVSWLFLEVSRRVFDFLKRYLEIIRTFVSVMGLSTALLLFFILLQTVMERVRPHFSSTAVPQQDSKSQVEPNTVKNSKKVEKEKKKDSKPTKTEKSRRVERN